MNAIMTNKLWIPVKYSIHPKKFNSNAPSARKKNRVSLPGLIEKKDAFPCTINSMKAMHNDPSTFSHISRGMDDSFMVMIGFVSSLMRGMTI